MTKIKVKSEVQWVKSFAILVLLLTTSNEHYLLKKLILFSLKIFVYKVAYTYVYYIYIT